MVRVNWQVLKQIFDQAGNVLTFTTSTLMPDGWSKLVAPTEVSTRSEINQNKKVMTAFFT